MSLKSKGIPASRSANSGVRDLAWLGVVIVACSGLFMAGLVALAIWLGFG